MAKKFQVIKATTREIPGVTVGGRVKRFASNGTFETSDAGEAAEIDKVLGAKGTGEVAVTSYDVKEQGHTYFFGPSWSKASEEFWERYRKKAERNSETPKKRLKRRVKRGGKNGV